MRMLVTGGCGFIGSHFVHMALEDEGNTVTNLDKLTYAGRPENVADLAGNKRYKFVKGDILDGPLVRKLCVDADMVVHFAAETHVDRSIISAGDFAKTDVLGTQTMLEGALSAGHKLFFHISTDEIYGSREGGYFKETDGYAPNSPYSASKAGAELMVRAYEKTYGLNAIITRSSNNYGPNQHPEKFIPRAITNLLRGRQVPIYGTGKNVRDWIYVRDNCEAIMLLLKKGVPGAYNIGNMDGKENIGIAKELVKLTGRDEGALKYVEDRKGHDFRYAIDNSKLRKMGWKARTSLQDGLKKTVDWYSKNKSWWEPVLVDK
jgi:dTDP-glucose 4,6-dehydratase